MLITLLTPLPGQAVDFAKEIEPLLQERCVKCHGPEKQKGGLRLDVKSSALKGGDSGEHGIVPGQPMASRLFQAVTSEDEDERMPPRKGGNERLSPPQIALLRTWIEVGAEWPESAAGGVKPAHSEMKVTEADRQHWAFQPLHAVASPAVADEAWIQTPVDRFIRRAQEERKLTPASAADARTLIRRMYFDVVGLPPTPEEMARWTSRFAASREAVSVLIEELLASPHHGERWARHWLDVARYADSDGQESDHDRPNAYRFRDFVIRALNGDMPYDQFVRWQLAGDEIEPDNAEAVAATGFMVAGNYTLLPVPMEEEKLRIRANELDDMVSTTAQAMLGLTLGCARCHDHKYDPLPTRDYYRLMRVFNSGDRTEVPLGPLTDVKAYRAAMAVWQPEYDAANKARDEWLKKAKQPLQAAVRAARIAKLPISDEERQILLAAAGGAEAMRLSNRFKAELKGDDGDFVALFTPGQSAQWQELDSAVKAVSKRKPAALPTAFAFADFSPEPRETWFFERGDFLARNEKMELGFLSVLMRERTADDYWQAALKTRRRDDTTQQRRAMADWITDLEHGAGALLVRVMVNRVWQHHFGEGLVRTVSDFGARGEAPTHPELLEWLTGEFIRSGWSLKHLHRLILNSATYQQASTFDREKAAADPENRLLWRRRPLRLESEILRDSMLAVAGTLNEAMYGPSFKPPIAVEALQARNVKDPYPRDVKESDETRRRTIYLFHKRVVQYPLMQAFDAPDAQQSCGRRMNTTVAPQALALLNDPFVRLRAQELAQRLRGTAGTSAEEQVRRAFALCLARAPSAAEFGDAGTFLQSQVEARRQRGSEHDAAEQLALADFCQALFGLNEFVYID